MDILTSDQAHASTAVTHPSPTTKTIDSEKMERFLHKAVSDFGPAVSAALVVIGDKLGLYQAMSHGGPITSAELARRTGTNERYVREWLVNPAASGYVDYDPASYCPDGTVLIVEPMAGETVEANLNPVGRVYSGASVLCCTPNAIASGQTALGTLATEAALRDVLTQGGFTRFRRATETPFNRVFEARP